jgi:hypothetical protein
MVRISREGQASTRFTTSGFSGRRFRWRLQTRSQGRHQVDDVSIFSAFTRAQVKAGLDPAKFTVRPCRGC